MFVQQILWYISTVFVGSLQRWEPRCSSGWQSDCLSIALVLLERVIIYRGLNTFQAAVYGIGVCAEFGGSVFRPLVGGRLLVCSITLLWGIIASICPIISSVDFAEALSRLDVIIRHPSAHNSDNVMSYDNAVSALGKICQFHRDGIDASQVPNFIFIEMQV